MGTKYEDQLDLFYDIQQQLFDTFDLGDGLRKETPHIFEDDVNYDMSINDSADDLEHLDDLYREGT